MPEKNIGPVLRIAVSKEMLDGLKLIKRKGALGCEVGSV